MREPLSVEEALAAYLKSMQLQLRPITLNGYRGLLNAFVLWLQQRETTELHQITPELVETYRNSLAYRKNTQGEAYALNTVARHVNALRGFFRWTLQRNLLLLNPAARLKYPPKPKLLPKRIFSVQELEAILQQPKLQQPSGLRDRAMLETLYATAIRASELRNLNLDDLDLEREQLWVRQGKGRKDRLLPIAPRACEWIRRYNQDVRPRFIEAAERRGTRPTRLFLSERGNPIRSGLICWRFVPYVQAVVPGLQGHCQLIRHAVATLMLENGCDVRVVQELLGHAKLNTTQLYTRVSISQLQNVYEKYHPAES